MRGDRFLEEGWFHVVIASCVYSVPSWCLSLALKRWSPRWRLVSTPLLNVFRWGTHGGRAPPRRLNLRSNASSPLLSLTLPREPVPLVVLKKKAVESLLAEDFWPTRHDSQKRIHALHPLGYFEGKRDIRYTMWFLGSFQQSLTQFFTEISVRNDFTWLIRSRNFSNVVVFGTTSF